MVRDESLRTNDFSSLGALADSHRIWLVDRKKGKVDAAESRHLFNRLCIPRNIYPESVKIKDISVAIALWMEDFPSFSGVVRRHGSVADSSGQLS